jgi:hypothetical protein
MDRFCCIFCYLSLKGGFMMNAILNALNNKSKGKYTLKDIYRMAFVSERRVSDYRNYGKDELLKVAFVLQSEFERAKSLLNFAGYDFEESNNRDRILKNCFEKKIFWIPAVYEVLKKHGESLIEY